jgi:N-methylhydantoinase B
LSPKTGRLELRPDQLLIVETPGAGGYGPPGERDVSEIEKDRRSGKFTAAYLRRHYGK